MKNKNFITQFLIGMLLFSSFAKAQSSETYISGKNLKIKHIYKENKIRKKDAFTDIVILYKGTIHVSDDDKMVTYISGGGYLKIYKKTFGNKRGIEIIPVGDKLKFNYFSGKKQIAFEPEGREWLAEILPEVVRETGIAAKERTLRFYKKGGVDAVLTEIENITSDAVRIKYYNVLFNIPGLSSTQYTQVIKSISDIISYDSNKRELLNANIDKLLNTDESSLAFFYVIYHMNYDSEKNKILKKLDLTELTNIQREGYLKVVESMDYDSEKAKALINYNNIYHKKEQLSAKYFTILQKMSYDSYRSKVLIDLMNKQKLSETDFVLVIVNLKSFSYDEYIAKVMNKINSLLPNYPDAISAYFSVFDNMSYDSYKVDIINNYIEKNRLNNNYILSFFKVAKSLDYDSYKNDVLLKLITAMGSDSTMVDNLFEVIHTMNYDSYREKIIQKLLQKPNISDYELSWIIKSVWWLDYDSAKVTILKEVKKYIQGKPKLIEQFKLAVKTINSDTEYRKLMEDSY